ncbi:mitochondrial inner membrane protein OXA1L [Copidosoma floridanum]|uniref:mitochondrial inner membrane protein OXA1L n=1 Tax=Copidosoma floridanum TaxID=29053 RepID=UPI0006C96A66|nr:mitochondrial inner membrane protein OXA1L [Copidosoma floridanum]
MFSRSFISLNRRITAKASFTVQNVTTYRSLHLACRNLGLRLQVRCHEIRVPVTNAGYTRHLSLSAVKLQDASTSPTKEVNASDVNENSVSNVTDTSSTDDLLSQIPEPPTPVEEIIEVLQTVGEPAFKSLGLGSWYPSGMVQQALEYLHVSGSLPWWACIMASTVFIRTMMFPVVIRMQRYAARMNNVQPEMQFIQAQLTDARRMGDNYEVMRLTNELLTFMKENNIDPRKNAWLPLLQAPIFISFYMGLRGMVNVPVESMKEGGLWWFSDLTIPDPYFLLPLLTSSTLFITLEMGTDTLKVGNMGFLKYVLRAIPVVMFPFIIKFEAGILCYWVSTNLFSLVQVAVLRRPKVRAYFDIPELIKHDTKKLPIARKNFVEGFKDSWRNIKVARDVGDREMYDSLVFTKAGKGPIPKTYKFDPTKPHPASIIQNKIKSDQTKGKLVNTIFTKTSEKNSTKSNPANTILTKKKD